MNTPIPGLPRSVLAATLRSPRSKGASPPGGMRRHSFAPNPGGLEMWLHIPDGLAAGAPLVVVLHGCTQAAVRFAGDSGWLALADRTGFAVLAPQQSPANNPNRCFNWFEPQHMHRDRGEPASIAAMIATAVAQHGLDRDRVYITGLSAGGAMAAVMMASYPEIFAGGAVVAGLPYGGATSMAQAFQAMKGRGAPPADLRDHAGAASSLPKLMIWHGDADHTVHADNGDQIARQWAVAQGLPLAPAEVKAAVGRSQARWRDAAGEVRIELNRVKGLGHGIPLDTDGPDGLGRSGPYLLQAGVNSTLETARFWGLVISSDPASATIAEATASRAEPTLPAAPSPHEAPSLGAQVMAAVSAVPPNVQAVIAEALTRGGLLK